MDPGGGHFSHDASLTLTQRTNSMETDDSQGSIKLELSLNTQKGRSSLLKVSENCEMSESDEHSSSILEVAPCCTTDFTA